MRTLRIPKPLLPRLSTHRTAVLLLCATAASCLKSGPEPECGNGVLDPGEVCDCSTGASPYPPGCPGPNSNGGESTCRLDCTRPYCGDGVVDLPLGEQCDDGNDVLGDACPSGPEGPCRPARCGDGVRFGPEAGGDEQCDGADLGAATCASLGLGSGTLTCDASCMYDSTLCATP